MNPSDYHLPGSVSASSSSSSSSLSSSSSPTGVPGSSSQAHDAVRSSHKRKAGRKKFKETRHPVYKGVRQRNGKWVCELRQPKKRNRMWLGTFPCPEMAATAYDVAALTLIGNSASFNFPDSVSQLPHSASSSIKDIRAAALKAIQTFEATKKEEEKQKEKEEKLDSDPRSPPFVDEEELFNMPTLLESMAEGLMLTPPALKKEFNWSSIDDEEEEFTLWTLD